MTDEVFRSDDLLVRRAEGGPGRRDDCCVVTFDSFTDFRTLDRDGFGEGFLHRSGIDTFHVIPRDNVWYQYPEMAEAMARVHAATRPYARVMTYGSSMGAYAAIRMAGLVGANAVLALSPQYSIDRAVVPWERRYQASSRTFKDVWEATLAFPDVPEAYIAYDPRHEADAKHVAKLATRFRFTPLKLPDAGHPVAGFLVETRVLQGAVRALARGTFDPTVFLARAEARRLQSSQYLVNLADATAHWRRGRRLALLREALRLSPDNPVFLGRVAAELRYIGRVDESLALYRQSVELAPQHPMILANYSLALERTGYIAQALSVMEEVDALTGGAALYQARLARLRTAVANAVTTPERRRRGLPGLLQRLGWFSLP